MTKYRPVQKQRTNSDRVARIERHTSFELRLSYANVYWSCALLRFRVTTYFVLIGYIDTAAN